MTTPMPFAPVFTVLIAAALSVACTAETDLDQYIEGQSGVASFSNGTPATVYLGGCNHFEQQEWVSGTWVPRGGEIECIWEGFAFPVRGESSLDDPFNARTEGIWRLAYDVGVGCSADSPLSHANCTRILQIYSDQFQVIVSELSDQALCETTGGIWDPNSCGHPQCGDFPSCLAIIPGCDCGPFANFVEGQGCIEDESCVQICGGLIGITCPPGTICDAPPACLACSGVCVPSF